MLTTEHVLLPRAQEDDTQSASLGLRGCIGSYILFAQSPSPSGDCKQYIRYCPLFLDVCAKL